SIKKDHIGATACVEAGISCRGQSGFALANAADSRERASHAGRFIVRTVIDDNYFSVIVGLTNDAFDGVCEKARLIPARNDNRYGEHLRAGVRLRGHRVPK